MFARFARHRCWYIMTFAAWDNAVLAAWSFFVPAAASFLGPGLCFAAALAFAFALAFGLAFVLGTASPLRAALAFAFALGATTSCLPLLAFALAAFFNHLTTCSHQVILLSYFLSLFLPLSFFISHSSCRSFFLCNDWVCQSKQNKAQWWMIASSAIYVLSHCCAQVLVCCVHNDALWNSHEPLSILRAPLIALGSLFDSEVIAIHPMPSQNLILLFLLELCQSSQDKAWP